VLAASAEGVRGHFKLELGDDLSDLFLAFGEPAEQETGVVFVLDEAQFLDRAELEAR
jgi:hypothetical protein